MSWTRLLAIARKETIQIRRDPRSLLVVLLMPVMLMALMGYGINLDQKHVPLCVYDREGSQQSQDLLHRFTSNEYFHLALDARNYRELTDAIDRETCALGIVIPLRFSERLSQGETVGVQAIVDGTDDNSANLAIGYATQVIAGFSSDVQLDTLRRAGGTMNPPSLTVEARTWFNEELESRNFMVPGVVAIVMAVIGTFLTSLTIAREWERGTMEQLDLDAGDAVGGCRGQARAVLCDRDVRRGGVRRHLDLVVRSAVSRQLRGAVLRFRALPDGGVADGISDFGGGGESDSPRASSRWS